MTRAVGGDGCAGYYDDDSDLMAYPVNEMTWWEASRVAKVMGKRVRRESQVEPLVWFRKKVALWYRQEGDGELVVVTNGQFEAAEFLASDWTILAPDEPDPPQRPPEPPSRPANEPGGGNTNGGVSDPPLPRVPPAVPGGGSGGTGGGSVVVDDFPPVLPDLPDGPEPPAPPKPPADPPLPSVSIASAEVSCSSGPSLVWSITGTVSPPGAAYSVVLLCESGHAHSVGVLIGSDPAAPQTLTGSAEPHDCVGATFRLTPLTGGGAVVVVEGE